MEVVEGYIQVTEAFTEASPSASTKMADNVETLLQTCGSHLVPYDNTLLRVAELMLTSEGEVDCKYCFTMLVKILNCSSGSSLVW